jgi:hypothetical protein
MFHILGLLLGPRNGDVREGIKELVVCAFFIWLVLWFLSLIGVTDVNIWR